MSSSDGQYYEMEEQQIAQNNSSELQGLGIGCGKTDTSSDDHLHSRSGLHRSLRCSFSGRISSVKVTEKKKKESGSPVASPNPDRVASLRAIKLVNRSRLCNEKARVPTTKVKRRGQEKQQKGVGKRCEEPGTKTAVRRQRVKHREGKKKAWAIQSWP